MEQNTLLNLTQRQQQTQYLQSQIQEQYGQIQDQENQIEEQEVPLQNQQQDQQQQVQQKSQLIHQILFIIILLFIILQFASQQKGSSTPKQRLQSNEVIKQIESKPILAQINLKINDFHVNEQTLFWGHFKPQLIYSISQRDINPLSMSLSYITQHTKNIMTDFKDKNNQKNINYNFLINNGYSSSVFEIKDFQNQFFMNSTFVKQSADNDTQQWYSIHKIQQTNYNQSIILSFGKELYEETENEDIHSFDIKFNDYFIKITKFLKTFDSNSSSFQTEEEGYFIIYIVQESQYISNLKEIFSFQKICTKNEESTLNLQSWDIKLNLKYLNKHSKDNQFKFQNNQCELKEHNKLIFLEFSLQKLQNYDIYIKYSNKNQNLEEDIGKAFISIEGTLIEKYSSNMLQRLSNNQIQQNDELKKCTISAVSNLFGGLSYKYGKLRYTQVPRNIKDQEAKAIFSFTPSRQRFSWSFLWDDGFHLEIASKFEEDLSKEIIKSWLDTMTEDGWICREQTRGKEAEKLCSCPDFLFKDNRDGNPPSLILSIEYFIKEKPEIIQELYEQGYITKLQNWFKWYMNSQMVMAYKQGRDPFDVFEDELTYVFKWWDQNGGLTQSYNSGMDDYPRNDKNFENYKPKGHIDAQSWMFYFAKVLENLFGFLKDEKKQKGYQKIAQNIKEATYKYFFDKKDLVFRDLIYNYETNQLQFTSHFGYPNILPLALGLINPNSDEFYSTINLIQNEDNLWTNYGLRSLSKNDYYFQKGNNYWTSPIWININYLLLKGLKKHYGNDIESKNLYDSLRSNVMKLVCNNWTKDGYFYENYDQEGKGTNAFPFTGWTATIALINCERY